MKEEPQLAATREKPRSKEDPGQSKNKHNEKILKAKIEKQQIIYKGIPIGYKLIFQQKFYVRREWQNTP